MQFTIKDTNVIMPPLFPDLRTTIRALALMICLCTLAAVDLAQEPPKTAVAQSDAQKAFEKLKTLSGAWEGRVTTVPNEMEETPTQVSMRVTSRGNALMHEMTLSGMPDDPITMFYVDGDRFLLTHYCDAGNRPRMTGKMSADGKMLEFDFVDITGSTQKGHMHRSVFTIIDANHHIEDWTFIFPGNKSIVAHFDLQRKK